MRASVLDKLRKQQSASLVTNKSEFFTQLNLYNRNPAIMPDSLLIYLVDHFQDIFSDESSLQKSCERGKDEVWKLLVGASIGVSSKNDIKGILVACINEISTRYENCLRHVDLVVDLRQDKLDNYLKMITPDVVSTLLIPFCVGSAKLLPGGPRKDLPELISSIRASEGFIIESARMAVEGAGRQII